MPSALRVILKGLAALALLFAAFVVSMVLFVVITFTLTAAGAVVFAFVPLALALVATPLFFLRSRKARKNVVVALCGTLGVCVLGAAGMAGYYAYQEHITVPGNVNIDVEAYMPFQENSKIARLDGPASLTLEPPLPALDGATALFPVYSAFVNAVYPSDTPLLEEGSPFQFRNTVLGYRALADGRTDIMFGAYPSQEQLESAEKSGVPMQFTPIGREGFVFFVNKNNPVDSLTVDQLRGIYSGAITNWREVGGKNEPIQPFQRNANSGSQSELLRFMGDTPLMTPPADLVNTMMGGIISQTADYKNNANAIGFSFRYYAQDMVGDKGIKLLAIDGIEPTLANIQDGSYPLTSDFYAVTTPASQHTDALIEWILSDEGQTLIERTGYARIR
jgi:phosphate transport system substrate-binding protein